MRLPNQIPICLRAIALQQRRRACITAAISFLILLAFPLSTALPVLAPFLPLVLAIYLILTIAALSQWHSARRSEELRNRYSRPSCPPIQL